MNHGSLFSGIGGFDYAAQLMGWQNRFHCEWNPFGQKVLKYYWPQAESYSDITKTDFSIWRDRIDILTGGFPCQPYSNAGKRLGKEDERHLWPEMLRAIREIQPQYVVGENVSGLVNWNGGMVFEEVQSELEAEGYEVRPFILPACAVNAPHRRDRIWFIAYSKSKCTRGIRNKIEKERPCISDELPRKCSGIPELERDFAYTESKRMEGSGANRQQEPRPHVEKGLFVRSSSGSNWNVWPTVSAFCDGNDGISSRLDGITFPKWRNESIKAGGNAIVPQVALQIFKAIQEFEQISQ